MVKRSAFALGFLNYNGWHEKSSYPIFSLVVGGKEALCLSYEIPSSLESMATLIKELSLRFKAVQSMVEQVGVKNFIRIMRSIFMRF